MMLALALVVVVYLVSVAIAIAAMCHLTWKWEGEGGDYKLCFSLGFIWPLVVIVSGWIAVEYCWDMAGDLIEKFLNKFQAKVIQCYKK